MVELPQGIRILTVILFEHKELQLDQSNCCLFFAYEFFAYWDC